MSSNSPKSDQLSVLASRPRRAVTSGQTLEGLAPITNIDSTTDDVSEALRELGGASVVLATAGNAQAMADTVGGLGLRGELVAVGVTAEPLPISPVQLISPALSVTGHPSGTARDIEETMHFAVLSGVRARIEQRRLLAQAAEAYDAMEQGRARYRMVLTM